MNKNPAIQLSLPSRAAPTRSLNRNKIQERLELISSTDRHLNIPDKCLPFCPHKSGKEDTERFFSLWDMENFNALCNHSKVLLCDGTLRYVRLSYINFTQLNPDWRLLSPCVHVLSSNKKESAYNRFFEALIILFWRCRTRKNSH